MKLLTQALLKDFEKTGHQEGEGARIIAKFFTPWADWTWYATEYFPEDRVFFGLVRGHETELGYFSLDELEEVTGPAGLKVERDKFFGKHTIKEAQEAAI